MVIELKNLAVPGLLAVGFLAYFLGWLPAEKSAIGEVPSGAMQCPTNALACEANVQKEFPSTLYTACTQQNCIDRLAECRETCRLKPGQWVQSAGLISVVRYDYSAIFGNFFYLLLMAAGAYLFFTFAPFFESGLGRDIDLRKVKKSAESIIAEEYGSRDFRIRNLSIIKGNSPGAERYAKFAVKSGIPWVAIVEFYDGTLKRVAGDVRLKTATHIDNLALGDYERSVFDEVPLPRALPYPQRRKRKGPYKKDVQYSEKIVEGGK